MTHSGEGLEVWRDDGDQLFSFSTEKWMGRNGLKASYEGFREEISARSTREVSPRVDSSVRRARAWGVPLNWVFRKPSFLFIFKIISLTFYFWPHWVYIAFL